MDELTELTIVQLLEEYNRLAAEPLKGWGESKDALRLKVLALREEDRKKRSARTIKSAAYEWLLKEDFKDHTGRTIGFSYDAILARLKEEFPDSDTTDKCLRWYQVQLNLDGAKVPWRPRRAPKRKPKEKKE